MLLRETLEHLRTGQPADISRFAASLRPEWIAEAFEATGCASFRKRKIPADKALWIVLGMALFGDRSIMRVVEHLQLVIGGIVASSAITRARQRLGVEPIEWLFGRVANYWAHGDADHAWRGLTLYGLDGSHLLVDDSEANDEYFGRPRGRAHSGYPQLRFVAMMNLATRMLVSAAMGPWRDGEVTLAKDLWDQAPSNSLVIIDRAFLSFAILQELAHKAENRHFLCRAKSNTRYEVTHLLPDESALALLHVPKALRGVHPQLPPGIVVRVVSYQHPGGEPGVVLTSLTDHLAYPASEVVEIYHQRWELEIGFDELKTHMLDRKEALRSKTPDGVHQEFWGILLTYNLVRREMASIASARGVSPTRISFTGAFLLIKGFFLSSHTAPPGCLPKELAELGANIGRSMLLPERRSSRRYPRQVKIKMSGYSKAAPRKREVA